MRKQDTHLIAFQQQLPPLAGKPLNVLEIGVFAARGAEWLLQNILTHPDSRYTGIDPWAFRLPPGVKSQAHVRSARAARAEQHARECLAPYADKVTLIKATARTAFMEHDWEPHSVDIGHIDGSHIAQDAALDTLNMWPLIRPTGILIWDDYRIRRNASVPLAVEPFLKCIAGQYEFAWRMRYNVAIRRIKEAS